MPASDSDYFIVIPVFNPPPDLVENIAAMEGAQPGVSSRILLVDDASTNGTVAEISARFPELKVIRGDGSLWWGGAIRLGMETALGLGARVVFWLNHDCVPDAGTIKKLYEAASLPGVGAASAWCYCREDRGYGVNPGFRNFSEIPKEELQGGNNVVVDGVNGNCVALSAEAIKAVGLPHARLHPHYGDGPYTWRLHQAGFKNLVVTAARASLEREFERCIDERDHSSIWHVPLREKLAYYFFSMRSKFHWKNRFHDLLAFRGTLPGLALYLPCMGKLAMKVAAGHRALGSGTDLKIAAILRKYEGRFPAMAFEASLRRLDAKRGS